MGTKHYMPTFKPKQTIYGTIGQASIAATDLTTFNGWLYLLLLQEGGGGAEGTISGTLTTIIYKTGWTGNKGKFKIFRDDGTKYLHIWTGPEVELGSGLGSITGLSVAVQAGDYLAFYHTLGGSMCFVSRTNAVKYYNTPNVDLQVDTPKTSWSYWSDSIAIGGIIEG